MSFGPEDIRVLNDAYADALRALYLVDHQYEKALHEYEEARALAPIPDYDLQIGRCQEKLANYYEAVLAYQHFLASNPGDPQMLDTYWKLLQATKDWKQAIAIIQKLGYGRGGVRLLTDLAGPAYYTLVLESTYDSLVQWEEAGRAVRGHAEWNGVYQKIAALSEDGRREILTVIE